MTNSFHEYLYDNTFYVYSDNNSLWYVLSTTKHDITGHHRIVELAQYNFTIYYRSGNMNVEADALSHIKWDQTTGPEIVQAIMKAPNEGPEALIGVYTCSVNIRNAFKVGIPPN